MSRSLDEVLSSCWREGRSALTEEEGREILTALNIPVVRGAVATSAGQAVEIAEHLGYPVVMKILSPDILHKSDIGGVRLGLACADDVTRAWEQIINSVAENAPKARIKGVYVQEEASPGIQVIVGGLRDAHFGPVVMFGLGGIYTEIFGDVAFRMAPITGVEAEEMIDSTKASRILSGFRGTEPADIGLICSTLISIGQALLREPRLREIEINPLILWPGGGGVAVDALVTAQEAE